MYVMKCFGISSETYSKNGKVVSNVFLFKDVKGIFI
jgi:hypothetical protein